MANIVSNSVINEEGLPEVSLPSGAAQVKKEPLRIEITPPKEAEGAPVETAPVEAPSAPAPEANQSSSIQKALNSGYSQEEIKAYLATTKNISEDEADLAIVKSVKEKVNQAKEAGYTNEDVLNYLIDNGYEGKLAENAIKSSSVKEIKPDLVVELTEEEKATEISDLYTNVYSKYSTMGKQIQGIYDLDAGIDARRDISKLNYAITNKLKEYGIDAYIDEDTRAVTMRNKDGSVSEVESSFLGSILNSSGELGGAIAGGFAGARAGGIAGAAAGAIFPPVEAFTVPAGVAIGAIAGSVTGASAGRGIDLLINSKKLSEDLEASFYASQMKEAGIYDAVLGVAGSAAFKIGAKSYKGVIKGYNYLSHGNPKGAYRALKENLNLTDAQAADMVKKFEDFNSTKAVGKTFEEKAISTISQTGQNAETAVRSAASQYERVSTILKTSVDARAKGLQKAVDSVANENVGKFIREDLKAYQDDVKDFFGVIKEQGKEAIDGTDFRFDIAKLAIEPVIKNIERKLSDPIAKQTFVGYASRIAYASEDRTFSGLLELRSAVNDFKYSKTLNTPDIEALNTVLNKIDSQINKAAKQYMPATAKEWTQNFSKAKYEYAKMKQLSENALVRLVNRPGATEETIRQALSKYGTDKDINKEVFDAIINRISPATRTKVEGAVIKNLTSKHTIGSSTDSQAIDFPQLAAELKSLNITTPDAKNLVKVVDEIAKVYKNDANLASIYGKTSIDRMQASLSNNLFQKINFAIVGEVWKSIMKYMPTRGARNLALVHQVSKLLENPLHVRTADELLKQLPKETQPEMRSLIKELQIEAAKKGPTPTKSIVNMYRQTKSGNVTASNGSLGRGVYLTPKIANPSTEMKTVKHEIDMDRMATLDDISSLVGRDVSITEVRKLPGLNEQLVEKGFLGITTDGRAMLFPETTLGVKEIKPKVVAKTAIEDKTKINELVKRLNNKELNLQKAFDKAKELGYSLHKEGKSASSDLGSSFIARKIPQVEKK
jgi:hypothetical protein